MNIYAAVEMEERALEEELECGGISIIEFNTQINELHRDARNAIREEAERAYGDVMNGY